MVDTEAVDVYGRYCGIINTFVVVRPDGVVSYHKPTDLTIAAQRQSLVQAIDTALGP